MRVMRLMSSTQREDGSAQGAITSGEVSVGRMECADVRKRRDATGHAEIIRTVRTGLCGAADYPWRVASARKRFTPASRFERHPFRRLGVRQSFRLAAYHCARHDGMMRTPCSSVSAATDLHQRNDASLGEARPWLC